MKYAALVCSLAIAGCSTVPQAPQSSLTWTHVESLSSEDLCALGAVVAKGSGDAEIVSREVRSRTGTGKITDAKCVAIQNQALLDINAVANARESGRKFGEAIGNVLGAAIVIGAVGAAAYYGGVVPVTPYTSPQPARAPVPPATPYVPTPLTYSLSTQNVNQAFTQKTCTYAGSFTVITIQPFQTCPPSVPQ